MRLYLTTILLFFLCTVAGAQHIVLYPQKSTDSLEIRAQNNLPCPMTLSASADPPDTTFKTFIPKNQDRILFQWPDTSDHLMKHLDQILSYDFILGDPRAVHDDSYEYNLPFPKGESHMLAQGNKSRYTHNSRISKYAFDFAMPEGSYVSAARGGVVGYVEEDFKVGGNDSRLMKKSNRIMICHDDGTVAAYAHLQYQGALVKVGDPVFAGQVIGLSGNTGYSTFPHLHFTVLIGGRSIPIRFRNEYTILYEGETYKHE